MNRHFTILLSFLFSCNLFAQDQNLISGKYSLQELQSILVTQAEWTPFPRLDDRENWSKADRKIMQSYIKAAESYMDYDWPTIPATYSLLIVRTGDRDEYQRVSFRKRSVLGTMILAEIAENKGRFIDQMINGIWSICEESWWGVPAHLPKTGELSGLMDVTEPFVDLFAAETGVFLAWADYFFGEKFDAVSPQIRKRIYNEVNYRLMQPLMKKHHWWMGKSDSGSPPNNWNPWICSNWINFVLLLEKDNAKRAEMIGKTLKVLDEFMNPYPQDGGCDEGPSYWGAAAASLYDNISLLNLATNDAFRYVYKDEKFKDMGRFIYRAQISEAYFLNFADADPTPGMAANMIYRYGKDIQDQDMMDFGAYYRKPVTGGVGSSHYFRHFFALFMQEEFWNVTQRLPLPKDVWLPDLQVAVARDNEGSAKGFYVATKGGHNAESHNHNDIGNYVVYYDGQPLLIDVGRGTYTARTFSDRRYDIWYNCSDYHNVPTVNTITQRPGKSFRATEVNYRKGKSSVEFGLDIAKAYPEDAGINSWKRTVTLNRNKNVIIKDVAHLQKANSIIQHMMVCYPAKETKPGEITIFYTDKAGENIDFIVKYDPKKMRVQIEKIKLETEEDKGIRSKWGDVIHRINFEVIAPKTKDIFVFEIRKN
ncbi:MAG: heparinase II/III-family protein [Bacteroidales bacterium]|jgi:hypothetical protein|nr:heparinase II/III-family protein [Bacteroidales bacterium]